MQQALALQPSNAPLQHDLGFLCLQAGRVAEAAAALEAALTAAPGFSLAAMRLGMARQALGQVDAAMAAYERAMRSQPFLVEAGFRAGALLESLGRRTEAIAAFRRAVAAAPNSNLGRLAAARALIVEGRDADAETVLRQLLAVEPGNAAAHDLVGHLLAERGCFDDARDHYQRAIAAAPLLAADYYDLVRCRRITADDGPLYERIQASLATPALPEASRVKIHLALGKVASDLGDPAAAMQHFGTPDTVRRNLVRFDAAAFEARIERLIAQDPAERFPSVRLDPNATPSPIFIVGLPRSGTTLIEQIISCHPDVHAAGELPFWTERAATGEPGLSDIQPGFLARAAADYTALLQRVAPAAARVTDKAPLNILCAGMIHRALPGATIVYCRRNLADTALSIHQTYFNPYVAFPTGGSDLVRAVRAVERLGAHWQATLPAERFVPVSYDQLVADPQPMIRRLIAGCGLPWDASCLHPEHNDRVIKTPSKWQARQPIRRADTPHWRRYEPWLGPLRALLLSSGGSPYQPPMGPDLIADGDGMAYPQS